MVSPRTIYDGCKAKCVVRLSATHLFTKYPVYQREVLSIEGEIEMLYYSNKGNR